MSPLYESIAGPGPAHKKFPHYRIASRKVFYPADNLPGKIYPARAVAGRGEFLPVNCLSGGEFSERRSYNRTPAPNERIQQALTARGANRRDRPTGQQSLAYDAARRKQHSSNMASICGVSAS